MTETLYVRTDDRDFEHGEIETTRMNREEHKIVANIHLVTSGDSLREFKNELEELLKKYAI